MRAWLLSAGIKGPKQCTSFEEGPLPGHYCLLAYHPPSSAMWRWAIYWESDAWRLVWQRRMRDGVIALGPLSLKWQDERKPRKPVKGYQFKDRIS